MANHQEVTNSNQNSSVRKASKDFEVEEVNLQTPQSKHQNNPVNRSKSMTSTKNLAMQDPQDSVFFPIVSYGADSSHKNKSTD